MQGQLLMLTIHTVKLFVVITAIQPIYIEKQVFSNKVWELEKYTKLNTIFCLIKSSGIVFIFLPAFDLIIWLMTSPKNFEKIAILKI